MTVVLRRPQAGERSAAEACRCVVVVQRSAAHFLHSSPSPGRARAGALTLLMASCSSMPVRWSPRGWSGAGRNAYGRPYLGRGNGQSRATRNCRVLPCFVASGPFLLVASRSKLATRLLRLWSLQSENGGEARDRGWRAKPWSYCHVPAFRSATVLFTVARLLHGIGGVAGTHNSVCISD